jgi:hypothetical protein
MTRRASGKAAAMTGADDEADRSDDRVESRAHLPEEEAAGSDDPERQAAAILEESEERTRDAAAARGAVEKRRSEDTVAPEDRGEA